MAPLVAWALRALGGEIIKAVVQRTIRKKMEKQMEGTKSLFASTTFWGVATTVVSMLLDKFAGFNLDTAIQGDITAFFVQAAALVGAGTALYGRIKATKKIA